MCYSPFKFILQDCIGTSKSQNAKNVQTTYSFYSHLRDIWKRHPSDDSCTRFYHIITARKRILRRLCFHRCLSVHGGEYLDRYPPDRYTTTPPPWAGTPHPHPPTLGRYTPPATVHAGIRSTSGRYASHWNAFLLVHTYLS